MRTPVLAFASVAGFTLTLGFAGCANDRGARSADSPDSPMRMAMMCPDCETVWARQHVGLNRGGINRYTSGREMVCPTCDEAAETMIVDGRPVIHDCPDCEVSMVPVTAAPQPANPRGPR